MTTMTSRSRLSRSTTSRPPASRPPVYRLSRRYDMLHPLKYSGVTILLCELSVTFTDSRFQQVDIFDQTFGPPNGGFDDR